MFIIDDLGNIYKCSVLPIPKDAVKQNKHQIAQVIQSLMDKLSDLSNGRLSRRESKKQRQRARKLSNLDPDSPVIPENEKLVKVEQTKTHKILITRQKRPILTEEQEYWSKYMLEHGTQFTVIQLTMQGMSYQTAVQYCNTIKELLKLEEDGKC